jgi:hypothetical protein
LSVLCGSAIVALADCAGAVGAAYIVLGCAGCLFCLAVLLLRWLIVLMALHTCLLSILFGSAVVAVATYVHADCLVCA